MMAPYDDEYYEESDYTRPWGGSKTKTDRGKNKGDWRKPWRENIT
jgi:hypothetical protein